MLKAYTIQVTYEGHKKPKNKRVHKKKYKSNPVTIGRELGNGKELTLKKGDTQVKVKTKQNKRQVQKFHKKVKDVEGNVSDRRFQNRIEGNKKHGEKSFSKKQKLKNFKHSKSDFVKSKESVRERFSNEKNTKKRDHRNGHKPYKNKINDFRSSKGSNPKVEKNKNKGGNFQAQNYSGDVSFQQGNNKVKNRKRNSAHLSEFQNNGPSEKKRKKDNDGSSSEMHTNSEKQVIKGKQFSAHKKFNEQTNDVNRNNTKNENEEMKSPYFAKNRFFDSSLTLRERMLWQLKSSRFRFINEKLYTTSSKGAEEMFRKDPNLFKVYHEGFRQQVDQWPENPVEKIIKAIQKKPANLVVADFGCGDAKIAKSVPNKVHSFDLVALSDEVTVCDMAHTPLESGCVDICVFCLSLMGTNLNSYLLEANRILKVGGTLKIAEVASRFTSVEKFIKDLKKYEFSLTHKDLSNDLFYFLNFKKDSNIKKAKGLPDLSLNPCWYKKR